MSIIHGTHILDFSQMQVCSTHVERTAQVTWSFGSWSSVLCSRSLGRPLVATAATAGGCVWSVSSSWTSRQTCFGSMSLSSFAVGFSLSYMCFKQNKVFPVTLWFEMVWTCLNQTWTTKGQPCGRILPQERLWHNVWRNLSFPVTWRRQCDLAASVALSRHGFPPWSWKVVVTQSERKSELAI